jgi:hypothetical protein
MGFNSAFNGLNSNYCPGQQSFEFKIALKCTCTVQCAEASTEGLIFIILATI